MRFSAATFLAFASVVLAQTPGFNVITAPAKGEKVPAGKTYEIVWAPDAKNPGAITIELYGGPADNKLNLVETLETGFDGSAGTYPWAVGSALGTEKVYGIRVILESNTAIWQWGNPFEITKGSSSSATVPVSTSVSATSAVEPSSTSTKVSSTITSTTASESSMATSTTIKISSTTMKISSSIIHGNYSTAHSTHTTEATQTTFVIGTSSTGSATASSTSAIVTNGVAAMGASSFALLGGVAMAILAL